MDFTLSDEQQAIIDLAARILGDKITDARLRELAAAGDLFADDAWSALAEAGILALCLPEVDGGSGFGVLELALVCEQVGRHVAPVPFLPVAASGLVLGEFASDDLRSRLLPGLAAGTTFVIPAVAEPGSYGAPTRPTTRLTAAVAGWTLDGEKQFVPWADRADALLVPATSPDGRVVLAVVDPTATGVSSEALVTTSGLPESHVRFDGVVVADVISDPGAVGRLLDVLTVGVCAVQAGVSEGALRLTATYTSERKQFGVPIATFQAVAHRAADAYIDVQGIRFTMYQAAWRLDEGLPAAEELHVAKFWAADGGHRVAIAAQHLHGGIGVDTDYPLHRFYLWTKQLELTLGGATEHLRRLGVLVAQGS